MNKVSLFLSIVALLLGAFVYRLVQSQSALIIEQGEKINNLSITAEKLDNRIQGLMELGKAIGPDATANESAETKTSKKLRLQMSEDFYCLVGVKGENSVVYFDGINRLKTWGDADGTSAFKSQAPDGTGTYAISGQELIMAIKDSGGDKLTAKRNAKILAHDPDGIVFEFEFYNTIYSSKRCPFKRDPSAP